MEIKNKVREIICQQLDVEPDEIEEDTSFIDDLNADSLSVVELVLAFEEAFNIDIPDSETEKIKTYRDAIDYITMKLS